MLVPEPDRGAVGVAVELLDRMDYVLSAPDGTRRRYGPVTLAGRFAYVSIAPDGRILKAYLLAGTELVCGGASLRLPEAFTSLAVADVRERTFELREPFEHGHCASGSYVLAGETGYEVESVTDRSITVRDYPAVSCESVTVVNSAWLEQGR